jgi:hypothetical protein
VANNEGWPPYKDDGGRRGDPPATFVTRDGYLKSGRSLAALRMGTSPGVGPKGGGNGGSDFGMDRISPRGFDPIGTDLDRTGPQTPSERVKR